MENLIWSPNLRLVLYALIMNYLLMHERDSHLEHICAPTQAGDGSTPVLRHLCPRCRRHYGGSCRDVHRADPVPTGAHDIDH